MKFPHQWTEKMNCFVCESCRIASPVPFEQECAVRGVREEGEQNKLPFATKVIKLVEEVKPWTYQYMHK